MLPVLVVPSPRPRRHFGASAGGVHPIIMGVALIGFRGGGHRLRDQASDQGPEQRLPAAPGVVDELEEAETGGQLLPRDAPVRPQPGAQRRRKPSVVLTWTAPEPSPSSSPADSPPAWP